MSAGDLLNRTHEELILLLIQLRKDTSSTARMIEKCCTEIHNVQVFIVFIVYVFFYLLISFQLTMIKFNLTFPAAL